MTRISLTLVIAALATSAAAGSDRESDLRFDTSKTPATVANVVTDGPAPIVVISTKGKRTPYAYINPYGVGPNNDSR